MSADSATGSSRNLMMIPQRHPLVQSTTRHSASGFLTAQGAFTPLFLRAAGQIMENASCSSTTLTSDKRMVF